MRGALWVVLFLSACAASTPRPAPEKLTPWTKALRVQQPEHPYAAVYKIGPERLVFLAAKHENNDRSATFRLIREAYSSFDFDTVIAEGFPTSRGANPPRTIAYALDSKVRSDGFVEAGELAPTVAGARDEQAELWGGEADDRQIKDMLLGQGIPEEDLLGFYILRNIPQWIRERKIEHAGDPRLQALVEADLPRSRAALELAPVVLPTFADWAAWYQRLNGRPIGPGFVTEEAGPLADGDFGTNRIAHAISRTRAVHLHNLIIEHLAARRSVLVVFGGSHLMIHRAALDHALGRPCYLGAELARAAAACR